MSTDGNHRQPHMTPRARSHYCCGRSYMLCSTDEFKNTSETISDSAECN